VLIDTFVATVVAVVWQTRFGLERSWFEGQQNYFWSAALVIGSMQYSLVARIDQHAGLWDSIAFYAAIAG
jgi:hypothetical protein